MVLWVACNYLKILCWLLMLAVAACSDGKRGPDAASVTNARQISVEGRAPIGAGGQSVARQAAIDDAVNTASVILKSKNAATTLISDIKVVDEWQEADIYHVQALAVLAEKQLCASPYRKKIVATAFPIMTPEQVSGAESQDLFSGIPREINNRLMESGDFIGRNLTNTVLYSRPDMAPEIPLNSGYSASAVILDIARQHDAQFVLSGVIRDFKIESTEYVRGSGILAGIKSSVRDLIGRRSIGVDVYVHDGFTGALLFQHRYSESILGDVTLPSGYTVGSERFESSPAGHKISEIIHQASDDIRQLFGCYPFAARVTQAEHNRIAIAAGAQDKIRVGDRLMVYSAGFAHKAGMGFNDALGVLTLDEVGSSMASGSFEATAASQSMVRPGDWVRSFATP